MCVAGEFQVVFFANCDAEFLKCDAVIFIKKQYHLKEWNQKTGIEFQTPASHFKHFVSEKVKIEVGQKIEKKTVLLFKKPVSHFKKTVITIRKKTSFTFQNDRRRLFYAFCPSV